MTPSGGSRARRRPENGLAAALLLAAFMTLFPAFAGWADIYRWEDERGIIHFTDDFSSIPPSYRDKTRPVVREAPSEGPSAGGAPGNRVAPPRPARVEPQPSESTLGENREEEREALTSQIEQLKAKIEAKEKLIRRVDEKRSLATNPYRNRFVDPADLDLYNKYQAELPQDREHLKDLESRLDSVK